MIENLTIFANSTLYTPMYDNERMALEEANTLWLLQNHVFTVKGVWLNGLIIMAVKQLLPQYLRERNRKNWILLNLGAVECYSHAPDHFLRWCCHYLTFYGMSEYFLPRMLSASYDVCEKKEGVYYQIMDVGHFIAAFELVLRLLEGFSVIVMGLNKPVTKNNKWEGQALEYNCFLGELCKGFNNVVYVDSWNLFKDYVVDTTHLTPEGHVKVFEYLQSILNEGK